MPLTSQEAFKVGFLLRCADEGLAAPEVADRIEKAASFAEKTASLIPSPGEALGGASKGVAMAAIGLPAIAGVMGGWGLHQMTANPTDDEDVKNQELIEAYRQFARNAQEHTKHKRLRQPLGI